MSRLVELHHHPDLDDPVMVVALEGWIDAGMGGANAASALLSRAHPEPVATFDPDELLDHRARRPIMHLVNGLVTRLAWASTELRAATDEEGRDMLLLVGAEPDFRWRTFTDTVIELADTLGVTQIVTLGAYPAPVPHTRPTELAVTTSSPELSDRLHGYVRGTLDVPAGIHSAIDVAGNAAGLPSLGLWAQVPHYVASMPYPAASLALLEGLGEVAGLRPATGELAAEARATRKRLDELVAENPQHVEMVHQLEELVDQGVAVGEAAPDLGFDRIPSGEELAAELQEYLRRRDDD